MSLIDFAVTLLTVLRSINREPGAPDRPDGLPQWHHIKTGRKNRKRKRRSK